MQKFPLTSKESGNLQMRHLNFSLVSKQFSFKVMIPHRSFDLIKNGCDYSMNQNKYRFACACKFGIWPVSLKWS